MLPKRKSLEASHSRGDWMNELTVPAWADKAEYLLYVGCAGAYDNRAIAVSRALVKVLNAAGVNYGVLGNIPILAVSLKSSITRNFLPVFSVPEKSRWTVPLPPR
ncbi:hypothetical protein [Dendrosporobacter quercicolus]|uniref:hypothetical protein n=1 Tax=Dendrosporobacter quercicolus TaxID=146817 RepID=UPI001FE0AA9A|nr:hypothetical protein [Dendrosporobacter quercicolus]